jgi:hypothetical protein
MILIGWQPARRVGLLAAALALCGPAFSQIPTPSREYIYAGDRLLAIIPPPALTIDDASVIEGQSGTRTVAFTVRLSATLSQPVTATYATANGTAAAGTDYVASSGTLTVAAGATSAAINVTVMGDTAVEPRETFVVNLANPVRAALADPQAQGTIIDDETTKYYTRPPCRIVDTRSPPGPSGGPAMGAGASRTFPVSGLCGIPATARSVALIVTTTGSTSSGNLRLYPAPGPAPLASAASFSANQARANNAIVALGQDGQVSVTCDMPAGHQTHVVLDVMGYFQ